jgi:tetratricopeptide (TPR) repeat protein
MRLDAAVAGGVDRRDERAMNAGWKAVALAILLAAAAPVRSLAAGDPACAAWPGEPQPLPRTMDAAPVRARWARLRAAELAELAREMERSEPATAHALFAHAACLEPGDASLREAARRTEPVRWHHPGLGDGSAAPPPDPAADVGQALALLDEPITIAPPVPRPEDADALLAAARHDMDTAGKLLHEARFEEALAALDRARRGLAPAPAQRRVTALRAQIEVATATAQVALGRDDAARESFSRALAAQPDLQLDPKTTSPKVLGLFQALHTASSKPGAQP